MLRRRSRTIPDTDQAPDLDRDLDEVHDARPDATSDDEPARLDLDLDLTGLTPSTTSSSVFVDDGADTDADRDRPSQVAGRRSAPLRAGPSAGDALSAEIQTVVTDTVNRVLSTAFVELELDQDTLQELREQSALTRLLEAVMRIEQQTTQLDGVARQLQALTTAVDELTDSTRALLRHQWDNMPPQNFWVRMQRADDEVRRSVDELAAEVRGRLPRPGRG